MRVLRGKLSEGKELREFKPKGFEVFGLMSK